MAGEGAEKRKAEDGDTQEAVKRPRVDGSNGGAPAAAPAAKKLGIDLEKLQRAKAALQKQKELAVKLKKAGIALGAKPGAAAAAPRPPAALPGAPAAAAAAAAASTEAAVPGAAAADALPGPPKAPKLATKLPPPLILDEKGREVDATGKPVERPAAQAPGPQQQEQQQEVDEDAAEKFFDPGLGNRALRRMQRRPRTSFQFVEEGKLQKQAEIGRLRAKYGDEAAKQIAARRQREAELAAGGEDANLIPLGVRAEGAKPAPAQEPIPAVEWWDARILADKSSYGGVIDGEPAQLREGRITIYVEHPVLIEPPAEAPPPPPQPLKLTKRELKKLRTQRRVAREKEKQELIRQGLLEPPKPKVKISNLMRVLGAEATADPTAIEAEVRKQMAERQAAHEDRNLARMLTPAERRDKKLKRLIGEDDGTEKHVALYKVGDLSAPQLRFKVDVNARENHMSGASLALAGTFALVVVEGTQKTLRRYEKLMLRRIDWNAGRDEEEEEEEGKPPRPPNYCHLVWQGVVKEATFRKFYSETVHTEAAARTFLRDHGVEHYWELCQAFQPE